MDPAGVEPFVLEVRDTFVLTGRGPVVLGPIVSGVIQPGERIGIVADGRVVATALAQPASVRQLGSDPSTIGLLLAGVDPALLHPGQQVRRLIDFPEGLVTLLIALEEPRDHSDLLDHEAARLVEFALGSWSDHWVSGALGWVDSGVLDTGVLEALGRCSADRRYSQEIRHRAARYLKSAGKL